MPVSKNRDRQCQNCSTDFSLDTEGSLHKYCSVSCRKEWHYERWKSSGYKRDKAKIRDYWLKHKYGISHSIFLRLLEEQNNKCAICDNTEHSSYNWHVDHCHTTGKVRGILCGPCNQAIGLFKENKETLQKAISYLEDK